jgi:hypothetical protein
LDRFVRIEESVHASTTQMSKMVNVIVITGVCLIFSSPLCCVPGFEIFVLV